ncbi:hypothetical protein [Xanthomonas citri]|nr:hypothetical protein [Xanthomonas citri]
MKDPDDDFLDEILDTCEHLPAAMWEPNLAEEIMLAPTFDGEKIVDTEE